MPRWRPALLALLTLASCEAPSTTRPKQRPPAELLSAAIPAPPAASDSACLAPTSAPAAPSIIAAATAMPVATGSATAAPSAAPPGPPGDVCCLVRGPIQLPLTGQATLFADGEGDPRVVFNRDGAPHAVTMPTAPKPTAPKPGKAADAKKPERLALGEPAERVPGPGCAVGGGSLFCIDKGGEVHRSSLTGEGAKVVARARSGSPLAAASLGGGRVAYAFLADRKTSEGSLTLAFLGVDEATPVQLSEDGAGATFVALASRGEEALAMYIDARRVLTPVHARVVTTLGKLGPDAVLFVGGGTDGRTWGAIGTGAKGNELVLLPIDKDERAFGMATIRVDEQPRDDAPMTWSLYPAAMDRPALAATRGTWPIRVLRTRPTATDPKAKKVLELGEIDAAGAFKASCAVAEGDRFSDLAIFADRAGAVWITYTDADGTWIERRAK